MCNEACLQFGRESIQKEDIFGRTVIEVGSLDVNGSFRSLVEPFKPERYTGIDIVDGPGVDEICKAENIISRYGKETFDVLIATELLEHVVNWQTIISNFKQALKPSGILIITTRSKGCFYHGFPYDYWRYEISDVKVIFSDFIIEHLIQDKAPPGVFVKARKPVHFIENNLKDYPPIYSIVKNKRCISIEDDDIKHSTRVKVLKLASKFQLPLYRSLPRPLIRILQKVMRKLMFH